MEIDLTTQNDSRKLTSAVVRNCYQNRELRGVLTESMVQYSCVIPHETKAKGKRVLNLLKMALG